jgi:hypothetical protein
MAGPVSDDVLDAHLPADQPHARWFLRRFASAIGDTYRTMDPFVAQVVAAPGVMLVAPPSSESVTEPS